MKLGPSRAFAGLRAKTFVLPLALGVGALLAFQADAQQSPQPPPIHRRRPKAQRRLPAPMPSRKRRAGETVAATGIAAVAKMGRKPESPNRIAVRSSAPASPPSRRGCC
jgi:hypothetical protein